MAEGRGPRAEGEAGCSAQSPPELAIGENAAVQFANPWQAAGFTQVAGQPVVSTNGSWMSVFSTTMGPIAILMPSR